MFDSIWTTTPAEGTGTGLWFALILGLFILAVLCSPGAARADEPSSASGTSAPVMLAQLEVPSDSTDSEDEQPEDSEDTGNWDTRPDSSADWQPVDQTTDKKAGIALPADTSYVAPAGILLPPVVGASGDTLRPVSKPPAKSGQAPAAAHGIGPQRPANTGPTERNGVLGISPVAIVAGLVVLHVFIVKAATN